MTGRMQAVLLHAGAGLLMGSMAHPGSEKRRSPDAHHVGRVADLRRECRTSIPAIQWYRFLGVVGGPQSLMAPIVKWASPRRPVSQTLYNSVVRAGEMAQRTPQGPVYLNVPRETMLHDVDTSRKSCAKPPPPPKTSASAKRYRRVSPRLLAAAHCPFIITDSAGRDPEAFSELVALADLMAIPVIESRTAPSAIFQPRIRCISDRMITPYLDETDSGAPRRQPRALVPAQQRPAERQDRRYQRQSAQRAHGLSDAFGGHLPRRTCGDHARLLAHSLRSIGAVG